MDAVAALIARMDEQRSRWVALPDGKRVQVRRPLQTEMRAYVSGVSVDQAVQQVCAWEGFSEADLLGAAIGSSDPLPFDRALWDRIARDRVDYIRAVAGTIADLLNEYITTLEAAGKN